MERHPTDDLAAFALGALDAAEAREVETHVARCDTCARQVAAHREALFDVAALAVTREPPARLRTKIVSRERGARGVGTATWTTALRPLLARPVPLAVPVALVALLVIAFAAVGQTRRAADAYARALAGAASRRAVSLAP